MTLSASTDLAIFMGCTIGTCLGIVLTFAVAGSMMRVLDRLFLRGADE